MGEKPFEQRNICYNNIRLTEVPCIKSLTYLNDSCNREVVKLCYNVTDVKSFEQHYICFITDIRLTEAAALMFYV